jgi:SET domain-containing protein
MVACRDFVEGETIFSNESLIFPEDYTIVVNVFGRRKWLDLLVHTVNVGNGMREFYYFDSFQNHSCDPSTIMVYLNEEPVQVAARIAGRNSLGKVKYNTIALCSIKAGNEITSDYEGFDKGLDEESFFKCLCGSSKFRGIIKA